MPDPMLIQANLPKSYINPAHTPSASAHTLPNPFSSYKFAPKTDYTSPIFLALLSNNQQTPAQPSAIYPATQHYTQMITHTAYIL